MCEIVGRYTMRKQVSIQLRRKVILFPKHFGVLIFLNRMSGKATTSESKGYWVKGSGLVYIPKGCVNGIPKALEEYRRQECDRLKLLTYVRRV